MSTFLVSNKDIYVDDETGQTIWADDFSQYCRQRLESSLATYLEEWFYDTTAGIPYFQTLFKNVKARNIQSVADQIFKRHIETRSYVKSLDSFSSSLTNQTRIYTCTFTVTLTNDETLSVNATSLGV